MLPGTAIGNPIDAPSGTLKQDGGRIAERILETIVSLEAPDAVVMHINLPQFVAALDQRVDVFGNLVQAALRVQSRHPGRVHFLLVLRSDGDAEIEARKREARARSLDLGIPVYDEVPGAARALAAVRAYERFREARREAVPGSGG